MTSREVFEFDLARDRLHHRVEGDAAFSAMVFRAWDDVRGAIFRHYRPVNDDPVRNPEWSAAIIKARRVFIPLASEGVPAHIAIRAALAAVDLSLNPPAAALPWSPGSLLFSSPEIRRSYQK